MGQRMGAENKGNLTRSVTCNSMYNLGKTVPETRVVEIRIVIKYVSKDGFLKMIFFEGEG